jgi:hypothetical protein
MALTVIKEYDAGGPCHLLDELRALGIIFRANIIIIPKRLVLRRLLVVLESSGVERDRVLFSSDILDYDFFLHVGKVSLALGSEGINVDALIRAHTVFGWHDVRELGGGRRRSRRHCLACCARVRENESVNASL